MLTIMQIFEQEMHYIWHKNIINKLAKQIHLFNRRVIDGVTNGIGIRSFL